MITVSISEQRPRLRKQLLTFGLKGRHPNKKIFFWTMNNSVGCSYKLFLCSLVGQTPHSRVYTTAQSGFNLDCNPPLEVDWVQSELATSTLEANPD